MLHSSIQKCLCEGLGTFVLVFMGTGAIIVNDLFGGSLTHVGISLVFGLVVLAMIFALGDRSGAHLNPAVSLGFFFANRISFADTLAYIISQCIGAIAASFLLHWLFLNHQSLGGTLPSISWDRAFVVESLLTFILMFVIISVATGSKEKGVLAGIAIGATVSLDALVGGPLTGASMNPARSLGPALVTGNFTSIWLYLTAPFLGAIIAVAAWKALLGN